MVKIADVLKVIDAATVGNASPGGCITTQQIFDELWERYPELRFFDSENGKRVLLVNACIVFVHPLCRYGEIWALPEGHECLSD